MLLSVSGGHHSVVFEEKKLVIHLLGFSIRSDDGTELFIDDRNVSFLSGCRTLDIQKRLDQESVSGQRP